jgi:hypothetical protein
MERVLAVRSVKLPNHWPPACMGIQKDFNLKPKQKYVQPVLLKHPSI